MEDRRMSDQEQGSRKTSAPAADFPRADPHIEDYLDHVCAPLVDRVPYAERTARRAELRTHLASLAEGYQELGSAPDDAIREALTQFGNPRVVARAWERATRTHPVLPTWAATLVALGCYVLTMAAGWASQGVHHALILKVGVGALSDFGTPLLAGLITGWLSPARPARGNLYSVALLFAIGLGACWATGGPTLYQLVLLPTQAARWMLIGCGAAVFGAELRKRREQRRKPWRLPA
jgi:hypothetical protein